MGLLEATATTEARGIGRHTDMRVMEGHDEEEDDGEMTNAPRKFVRSQNEL